MIFEDAQAGVEAGRRGGFGLVIGVHRHGDPASLRAHGADVVVEELSEVAVAAGPPSALERFDEVVDRLRGRRLALFLDYDGTLTPIVERPEDALLSDSTRDLVRRLAGCVPVAVVSGRDRSVVAELVGLHEVFYVGSHGLDIEGPPGSNLRHRPAAELLPALDAAEASLRDRLAGIDGARIERKRFTVAVHYRSVAAAGHADVERAVDEVRRQQPRLRKEGGKCVWELRPDIDWDKGQAVLWLLEHLDLRDALPMHLGDDVTDESVFRVLAGRGIGIIVEPGSRPSAAELSLADPAEVELFLARLLRQLSAERPQTVPG